MTKMRKVQLCWYTRDAAAEPRSGLAWLNGDFGDHDVAFIVDGETGEIQGAVWDYRLLNRPLGHLDQEYIK